MTISPQNESEPSKTGWAKIDTGASNVILERELVDALGLTSVGPATRTNSSNRNVPTDAYIIHINFPDLEAEGDFRTTPANLKSETFQGESVIAMLGRDFLSKVKFIYDGKTGAYELSTD